ncbi:hypothetical protein ACIPM2_31820 [Streptomyces sp. NPDC086081]|uniref:hypothetical protein n=1 Tax=Streptomyces sp. NPDC086081 TaxID=3365749 RepID=UPI0037FB7F91
MHRGFGQGVELGRGLAEEKYVGSAQQRAGERDPLAFTAGDCRRRQFRVETIVQRRDLLRQAYLFDSWARLSR